MFAQVVFQELGVSHVRVKLGQVKPGQGYRPSSWACALRSRLVCLLGWLCVEQINLVP